MTSIRANPFALLSGGDSDDEGGQAPTTTIKTKAPISVAPVNKKPAQTQQPVKRDRGDYPPRGGPRKVYGATRGAPVGEIEVIGAKPHGFTEQGRDDRAERRGGGGGGPRGRGARGRGAGRGRGGRFEDRPDRHSTTGVHDTDRKVASGWGAEEGKQELQAETEGYGDAKVDKAFADDAAISPQVAEAGGEWGAGAPDGDAAPVTNGNADWGKDSGSPDGQKKAEEEEDHTKTYEEYLAEKANNLSSLVGKKETRKPNEGIDESQWKGAVQLIKDPDQEEVFFQVNKEKKAANTASNKKTKEKTYIEVEPLGYRPPRSGGDRGGRGRGRGRGGPREFGGDRDFNQEPRESGGERRGGGRGGRGGNRGGFNGGNAREFNAEDANAFPSLI